jgi:hypothetical protein
MRQRSFTSAQKGAAKAAPQGAWDLEPEFFFDGDDEDIQDILRLLDGATLDTEVSS